MSTERHPESPPPEPAWQRWVKVALVLGYGIFALTMCQPPLGLT